MDNTSDQKIAELLQLFETLEEYRGESKSLETLRGHLDAVRRAEESILNFRQRLADIFAEPIPAFQKFSRLVTERGIDAAALDLANNPDSYGALKGWSFGPLNNPARAGILKLSLPMAVRSAVDGFTAHMQTGGGGVDREDLARKVNAAQKKLGEMEQSIGSMGKRIELELKIAELAKEISFSDLANLPKEQYRLVESLRDKYRTLIQTNEGDPAKRAAAAAAAKKKKG